MVGCGVETFVVGDGDRPCYDYEMNGRFSTNRNFKK